MMVLELKTISGKISEPLRKIYAPKYVLKNPIKKASILDFNF